MDSAQKCKCGVDANDCTYPNCAEGEPYEKYPSSPTRYTCGKVYRDCEYPECPAAQADDQRRLALFQVQRQLMCDLWELS